MEFDSLFKYMMIKKYLTPDEIKYYKEYNFLLNPYQYDEYLSYKLDSKQVIKLPLKTFDGNPIHFFKSSDLLYSELELEHQSTTEDDISINISKKDEITLSRIYSEIEGSLEIESVPSTRKIIKDIYEGKKEIKTINDLIIKNMIEGIKFVSNKPEFNKDNLYKLYTILSYGCLDDDDKLREGELYRYDGVTIGHFNGCPYEYIDECMDSLFKLINDNLMNPDLKYQLPHIAHYYIALIHPYFDYNGRTARMVSLWISLLINSKNIPLVLSDAINQRKTLYYKAIEDTRLSRNDLSYFLIYVNKISLLYLLTYKNIDDIEKNLVNKNIILTNKQKNDLKIILVSSNSKFTYNEYIKWSKTDMTKQGAFKVLNIYAEYGILKTYDTNSGNKIFEVNKKLLKYNTDHIM